MRTLLCILGIMIHFYAFASIETKVSYINGSAFLDYNIHGGNTVPNTFAYCEVTDFFPQGNSDWQNNYRIVSAKGRVELYIDGSAMPLNIKYSLEVPVEIKYYKADYGMITVTHTLKVDYDPVEGSYHKQLDMWQLDGVFAIRVRVKGDSPDIKIVSDTPLSTTQKEAIANVVKIRVTEEYDKVVNFDYTRILTWNEMYFNYNNADRQLDISWKVIEGAETYDLEWTYVEKYLEPFASINGPLTNATFSFSENSSRVSLTTNVYTLPIVYEKGVLVFRVRGKGKVLPDTEHTVTGPWSCGRLSNCDSYDNINPSLNFWRHAFWMYDAHENDSKNWQVVTSFAEEGKRKDVVNYMDGTMRTRQTVTVNNTDNNVLVAETMYDHQGRAAIQILPAPVLHDPALKFRANFNRNLANQPYSKSDFDMDILGQCAGQVSPLNSISGAAYYYSPQFFQGLTPVEKNTHLAYIPKSDGYPMIQTEYTPDNTGRILRQGGAGTTFQLESKHETKYLYGTPAQEELDYLFGTNVGQASHYKKNVVQDPNGQASVSYLDAKGNTIATALSGLTPAGLDQLDSYAPFPMVFNLLAFNRKDTVDYSLDATFTLAVDSRGDHKFYYGVTAEQFFDSCTPSNVCYDCIYDLELLVVSNECPDTFFHLTKTIGSFFSVDPATSSTPSIGGGGSAKLTLEGASLDTLSFGLNTTCGAAVHFNTNILPANNAFTIYDLPVGTYSVIKRLKVNQDAAIAYLEHYINDPNNVCTNVLEDMLNEQLDLVDIDDCYLDCDDVDQSSTDPDDMELAEAVCDTVLSNPCDIALEVMKAHMTPGGQYADFDPITYYANSKPLSIFNTSSYLKFPRFKYKTMDFGSIQVLNDAGNLVSPKLLTVEEFVLNFDPSWLDYMVIYHPEYCMYDRCKNELYDANTFMNQIHQTDTYQDAVLNGMTPSSNAPYEILDNDIYFDPGQVGALDYVEMQQMMEAYPHAILGEPSIWNIAVANAFFDGNLNDPSMGIITPAFLIDPINSVGANYFWATYKSLYISLKEKIEYKKRVKYAMEAPNNCYNECIGQINFGPVRNGFMTFSSSSPFGFTGEYYNDWGGPDMDCEPCNSDIFYYFHDKVKAFPSPYDMLPNMDVDFWDAPLSDLYNNVAPSFPDYPCDTCDCKTQLNVLLNVLLMDEVADKMAQANTNDDYATELNNLDVPIQNLQLAFNKLIIPGLAGQNVNFYKDPSGHIIIVFGNMPMDDGCTIRTNVTVKELLPIDSISIDKCPTPSPIAIYDMVIAVSFYTNGSLVMTKDFTLSNSCTFKCKPENTPTQKCEALPIANDLLAYINQLHHVQNIKDNFTNPTLQTVSYSEVSMGSVLLDSLVNLGFGVQDNTPLTSHSLSNEVVITFGNIRCLIHLNLGNNNQHFGGPFITHFTDLVPDYTQANAQGYTSSFKLIVHFANGTTMNAIGKFADGNHVACIPIGRCCIEEKSDGRIISNSQGKPRENKSVITKTNTKKNKSQSKPKTSTDLTKDPKPLPTNPKPTDPPKPFEPLCDDCITLNLGGSLFDGIKPPCPPNWCDTSLLATIELDSIPNPCAEHLYNVAAANAMMLYEAYIDSVAAAFLHAYNMKCLQATEALRDSAEFGQHHFTLYYYDQSNNLVQTVPPNGVTGLDPTEMAAMSTYRANNITHTTPNPVPVVSSILQKWTSNYTFNSLNQITTQKIPDQGIYNVNQFVKEATVFWYDMLGRLVCSTSPEQRTRNEYAYTIYDDLGRIREVGAVKSMQAPPASPINTDLNNWTYFLSGDKTQITTTTYDIDFYEGILPPNFPVTTLKNLRGRVSAAAVYDTELNLDNKKPEYITHYSYDIHGNVEAVIQDGNNTPPTLIEYDYDLISGKVNTVYYEKNKADQFIHRYQYDADNRLVIARTSANGIHWDEDAYYQYYPHGPLARTEIGEDEIQGLDYAYTLQGWIKGVNSASLTATTDMGHDGLKASEHKYFGQDVTGFILHYFDGDYGNIAQSGSTEKFESKMGGSYAFTTNENLYNGNIRAMVTAIRPFIQAGSPAGYKYQYDQLHRIKGMDYFSGMSNNNWALATIQNDYKTLYSYDANGNILSLDRKGTTQAGNYLDMDKLSYTYAEGNNRLTHVDDVISVANYKTDIDDQNNNNYQYDHNGNLIRDNAEGLSIEWNLSGKVSKIKKDNGTIIKFRYDALGNRIMKSHNDTMTWYVRDASGNAMATYTSISPTGPIATGLWQWSSVTLYGSARLGELSPVVSDPLLTETETGGSGTGLGGSQARLARADAPLKLQYYRGRKQYELTNHLGNVLATVSDRKLLRKALATETGLYAHVITAQDYYPEGMMMPFRTFSTKKYDQKHQGQLTDPEIYGEANSYYYKYRMSDPRLCRFWSVDPLYNKYAYNSNYAFSENNLINAIELEGLEAYFIHGTKAGNSRWLDDNGKPRENTIQLLKMTPNTKYNAKFEWGNELTNWGNGVFNSSQDRHEAAIKLVDHIMAGASGDEAITLIGHSHGGNVAIQAIPLLRKALNDRGWSHIKINLITLCTPADNSKLENPDYISNMINEHIHLFTYIDAIIEKGATIFGNSFGNYAWFDEQYKNTFTQNIPINTNEEFTYDMLGLIPATEGAAAHSFDFSNPELLKKNIDNGVIPIINE